MFVYNQDAAVTACEPGVGRKVLAYEEEVMMCEITFEKGAKGMRHSHPHKQITYIAEGEFLFTIGEESRKVSKGDSVFMPSGVEHETQCLQAGKLVDVFVPMRKEFVDAD